MSVYYPEGWQRYVSDCTGADCKICEAYHNEGDSTCSLCGHETLCLAAQNCDGNVYDCNYCGLTIHEDGEDIIFEPCKDGGYIQVD